MSLLPRVVTLDGAGRGARTGLAAGLVPGGLTTGLVLGRLTTGLVPGRLTARLVPGRLTARLVPGRLTARLVPGRLTARLVLGGFPARPVPGRFPARPAPGRSPVRTVRDRLVPRPAVGVGRHPGHLRRRRLQRHRPGPDQPQLDGLARQHRVQHPVRRDPDPVAGHRREVVAAGHGAGRHAGQRNPERIGGGLGTAEVHHEPHVLVAVRPALTAQPERGGDVLRAHLAVPPGVLRGHRRVRARVVQVRHGGHVAAGEQLGTPRHLQVRVDEQPAALQGQPQGSTRGRAARPRTTPGCGCRRSRRRSAARRRAWPPSRRSPSARPRRAGAAPGRRCRRAVRPSRAAPAARRPAASSAAACPPAADACGPARR